MSDYKPGQCVYKKEVMEIMKSLDAKSVVLVVVGGNRNIDYAEVAAAVTADSVDLIARIMTYTGLRMKIDARPFMAGTMSMN